MIEEHFAPEEFLLDEGVEPGTEGVEGADEDSEDDDADDAAEETPDAL